MFFINSFLQKSIDFILVLTFFTIFVFRKFRSSATQFRFAITKSIGNVDANTTPRMLNDEDDINFDDPRHQIRGSGVETPQEKLDPRARSAQSASHNGQAEIQQGQDDTNSS